MGAGGITPSGGGAEPRIISLSCAPQQGRRKGCLLRPLSHPRWSFPCSHTLYVPAACAAVNHHPLSPMSSPIHILIDTTRQLLTLQSEAGQCLFTAPVSTGKAGLGSEEGSGRTPLGRFAVYSLHGENAPRLTVFRGRVPVGTWPEAARGEDAILTRIITLEGLEPHNANTRARYIYIHGTNEVEKLGTPASHGCIRLSPEAMEELFAHSFLGMNVFIINY